MTKKDPSELDLGLIRGKIVRVRDLGDALTRYCEMVESSPIRGTVQGIRDEGVEDERGALS